MIIEQCDKLENKFNEYEKLRRLKNDLESLSKRQQLINESQEKLSGVVIQLHLLKNNKIATHEDIPDVQKTLNKLEVVQHNFEKDNLSITRGNDLNILLRHLETFKNNTETNLMTKWRTWFVDETGFINEDLLDQFKAIPKYRSTIDKITFHLKKIVTYKKNIPSTQEELETIKETIESIRDLIDSMPIDDFPEDVQKFLKELNTQAGAGLDCLTETVVKWLKDNGLTSNYRVKPSSIGTK